jgi:hypothetical protein
MEDHHPAAGRDSGHSYPGSRRLRLAAGQSERHSAGLPTFVWDDEQPANQTSAKVSLIFKSRWFYIASLAIFGDMFAISGTATWVVPAFIQTQGMAPASAAAIGTLMGLSQIIMLLMDGYCRPCCQVRRVS